MDPLLKIRQLTKCFGDKKALNAVSLDLFPGEIVSLLGANGAGKTTLSSIVATLRPPTSGEILFNDKSIYDDICFYREHIGYCAQKPNLNIFLTCRENLVRAGYYYQLARLTIDERIELLATKFGLHRYLDEKPLVLSGGYKQRFMIARSLIHNPRIIILDEPTVALDPHIRNQLWEYIKILKNDGLTVLLTTHYLDEAEVLSDRVCVLDNGVVKLIDTPTNLMASFSKSRLEDVFLHLMNQE